MMIWPDFGLLLAAIVILLLLGIGYNLLIAEWERKKYLEGFTSLAVVVGVLITLLVEAGLNWQAAVLTLICFAASGLPMVAGSIWRYIKARKAFQEEYVASTARLAQCGEGASGYRRGGGGEGLAGPSAGAGSGSKHDRN